MERYYFENCNDLAEYMIDKADNNEYVVAALYYEEAMQLIRKILLYDDMDVQFMNIEPPEFNGYNREYYVSLSEDMVASVDPAYIGGKYLRTDADLTLVDGEAHSSLIQALSNNPWREICIGEEDEEYECDCCEDCVCVDIDVDVDFEVEDILEKLFDVCKIMKDKNGKPIGFKFDIFD